MNTHIQTLAKAGAHFVQCRKKTAVNPKAAVEKEWQNKMPTAEQVCRWLDEDKNVGLRPVSVGCVVIDLDPLKGKDGKPVPGFEGIIKDELRAITAQCGPPLATVKTPSGGRHLFYKSADDMAGNVKWRSGDIRQSSGYIVLYDIPAVCSIIEKLPDAQSLKVGDFLSKFGKVKETDRTGEPREGNWVPGHRNNTLFHKAILAGVIDNAAELKAAKAKALDAGLPEIEVEQAAANGWKIGEAGLQKGTMQARDKNNFLAMMKAMGLRFRYNERSAKEEISQAIWAEKDGITFIIDWCDWEELSDLWRAKIASDIEMYYRVVKGKGSVPFKAPVSEYARWIMAIVFDEQVDPFHDLLMRLPEWDRKKRLDTLLIDLFKAPDDPFTRWASRYLPLAAIQRTFYPGGKLDEMPILFGQQGIGKSAYASALLGGNGEFFRDSLSLSGSDKEQVEAMIGGVIIEIAELTGIRRAHTDHLKAFLSRQADHVRLAYRRDPVRIPRRCVFFGTTDRVDVLPNDPAGNRRFVVIESPCTFDNSVDVEEFMAEHRDQIWAEALHLSNTEDATANLPWDLKEEQARRNKEYRSGDEYLEALIERLPLPDPILGFTMADIYDQLKVPSNVNTRSFGEALKLVGWTKRTTKVGGKKANRWFPPAGWKPIEQSM